MKYENKLIASLCDSIPVMLDHEILTEETAIQTLALIHKLAIEAECKSQNAVVEAFEEGFEAGERREMKRMSFINKTIAEIAKPKAKRKRTVLKSGFEQLVTE